VRLSVARDFELVEFELAAISLPYTDSLSRQPAPDLVGAPAGDDLHYGVFTLGNRENRRFAYVLDASAEGGTRLYVDLNQNGNLTDDGAPLANQGTGFFAARIAFPAWRIFREHRGQDEFNIWFFTQPEQLARGRASHYSRTQAKGSVAIGGARRLAYLVDRGPNDADLSNDGIYVDADGNGEIDRRTEYFVSGAAVQLGERQIRFQIE
jgi:hypothetical protein